MQGQAQIPITTNSRFKASMKHKVFSFDTTLYFKLEKSALSALEDYKRFYVSNNASSSLKSYLPVDVTTKDGNCDLRVVFFKCSDQEAKEIKNFIWKITENKGNDENN